MAESRFWTRVVAVAGAALLLYLLARILRPFLGPILWASLLAFLLFPVNRALRRRLSGRRGLASILLTLAVTVGIVVPSALLMLVFFHQATDLLSRFSDLAARYQIERPQDLLNIPALGRLVEWVDRNTPFSAADLQTFLVSTARHGLEVVLPAGRQVVLGAVGAVVGLLLMLFILYFLFRDGDEMARRTIALVPLESTRKNALVDRLAAVMRAVVFGSLATALIQGGLVGVAFQIVGLASPVVFGFLTALAALLPVGGTALVWAPAAAVLYGQGHPGRALFMLIWGAVLVGSIDNFLRPRLISGRAEISTLPVFFGVMGGLAAFGPIGMFVGPLVIALALALLGFAEEPPPPAPG
ncbi:MAG TPA: AI-2E family transporter [Thermoanaerobaculia bacterium]|nr:AI-2E family transporter [Thermoanaerobaculia bacterium]